MLKSTGFFTTRTKILGFISALLHVPEISIATQKSQQCTIANITRYVTSLLILLWPYLLGNGQPTYFKGAY